MVQRCFVAGSPIGHSRSPLIHGHWMAERGLDARYERLDVKPDDLPALLAAVRDGTFRGGNLTIPLKQVALPLLDHLSDEAKAMGAVNTVYMDNGRLVGANTDVAGFLAHLDLAWPGWDAAAVSVLLLGAGGAARAIAHGLMARNLRSLAISNRSPGHAAALAADMAAHHGLRVPLATVPWPVAPDVLSTADVVINATSLGMKGQHALDLAWPAQLDGTIAYDIVYAPLLTPFLADATARGGRPVDGLGMLLHQASLAFGHWFGDVPAVTAELRAIVEADLAPVPGQS